ncbi:FAD-binding protein [Streptomyces natalensis]|uniref:FAD-binding protein n=1 Tax=Streptomyces natalensis TaxID=68242 RepID=UPI0030B82334
MVAAVAFARAHGLPVAVQATGHGLSAATDGGLLISTRRMSGVRMDAAARTGAQRARRPRTRTAGRAEGPPRPGQRVPLPPGRGRHAGARTGRRMTAPQWAGLGTWLSATRPSSGNWRRN